MCSTGTVALDNDREALITGTDAFRGTIRLEMNADDGGDYNLKITDPQWNMLPNGTVFAFANTEKPHA